MKLKFQANQKDDFFTVVKKRVEQDFAIQAKSCHANWQMWLKTLLLLVAYVTCYGALISNSFSFNGVLLLYCGLGIIKPLIGFNVTHDALHGAYSHYHKLNRFLGYSFDINGTSSYIWKITHNVLHHTYTNIPGHDSDIDKAIWLRLSPKDEVYWFHRYQPYYAPFLYCLTSLNWILFFDPVWFYRGAINGKVPPKDTAIFTTLKIFSLFFFIGLPMYLLSLSWWQVLLGYFCMQFVGGFMIALVFQLAHIVESVAFPEPDSVGRMANNWATHELLTTSNFATHNRVLSYFLGGLNFQIEHHLFPNVCHVHYPHISKIVKKTTEEFGLPYNEQPTFFQAIGSHFRMLGKLGRGEILSNPEVREDL